MTGTIFSDTDAMRCTPPIKMNAHTAVRHAESVVAGLGDGVGLHHRAHEAEGEDYRDREEACEELAAAPLEGGGYVVHGAAADRAILMDDTRGLREDGFGVYRRHAEKRDYPHPEYRAGAADEDRAGRADDVAGSDLRGDGGGERLERAHAAVVLLAEELDLAERLAHGRAEIAKRVFIEKKSPAATSMTMRM